MNKKVRTISLIVIIFICIIVLVFLGMRGNVIYYYSVSEAVDKAPQIKTSRFRLAGVVVDGSIKKEDTSTSFQVTDGSTTATVIHRGDPPELFKDGAPVVVEGHWQKGKLGKVFESDRIMIKHGNEYTPPKVDQNKDKYVDDGQQVSTSIPSTSSTLPSTSIAPEITALP